MSKRGEEMGKKRRSKRIVKKSDEQKENDSH